MEFDQYIAQAPHSIAVRVWQGALAVEKARTTAGNEFILLNLPFLPCASSGT